MEQIINFLGAHHISHQGIAVLGGMEASLLTQWTSVLHMADVKDSKTTAEDQHLTATLGMAIGHTIMRTIMRTLHQRSQRDGHSKPSHYHRTDPYN